MDTLLTTTRMQLEQYVAGIHRSRPELAYELAPVTVALHADQDETAVRTLIAVLRIHDVGVTAEQRAVLLEATRALRMPLPHLACDCGRCLLWRSPAR